MGAGSEESTTAAQVISLTAVEAAELVRGKLAEAATDSHANHLDAALDSWTQALGLGLQLGPAPTEQVLVAVIEEARHLSRVEDAHGLSKLGPALAGLVTQVREAGALPPNAVMEAWATLVGEVGALIGQVGLVLALPQDQRIGLLENARARAVLVDEATETRFDLGEWIAELKP